MRSVAGEYTGLLCDDRIRTAPRPPPLRLIVTEIVITDPSDYYSDIGYVNINCQVLEKEKQTIAMTYADQSKHAGFSPGLFLLYLIPS